MTNFLKETESDIAELGKTIDDIIYIGTGTHACTWTQFAEMADAEYYKGYGTAIVMTDLVILFKDGTWLERGEYDGSEWWEYKRAPNIPHNPQPLEGLFDEKWRAYFEERR